MVIFRYNSEPVEVSHYQPYRCPAETANESAACRQGSLDPETKRTEKEEETMEICFTHGYKDAFEKVAVV